MLPDRLAGIACVALAAGIAIAAFGFYVPYQYEPLGPAVFPYLVAAALCIAGGFLAVRPDTTAMPIGARHIGVLSIIVGYAYLLEPMGFPATTTIAAFSLGMVLRLPAMRALAMALLLTLTTYAVLVGVLDLNLPNGWIWANLVSDG